MHVHLHHGDLPDGLDLGGVIGVDSEAMGLDPHRDRLCLVQLCAGDGEAHLVKFAPPEPGRRLEAPNLAALLSDRERLKIFHYARFDMGMFARHLGVTTNPVYCTKIASRLARTYTDRHGFKDLCRELLEIDVSKQQQSSDWGAETLSEAQIAYAATDVLHLHALKARLDAMLARERRSDLAAACFSALPLRVRLDLAGWSDVDIFSHS